MKTILTVLISMMSISMWAAYPSYNNFDTNQFLRSGNTLSVKTNSYTWGGLSGGSQVWTNSGGFIWPSGTPGPSLDGLSPGPDIFFNTNGGLIFGQYSGQDFDITDPLLACFFMTESNQSSVFTFDFDVANNENYDQSAGMVGSIVLITNGAGVFGMSSMNYTATKNGHSCAIILTANSNYTNSLTNGRFLQVKTNNVEILSLAPDGTLRANAFLVGSTTNQVIFGSTNSPPLDTTNIVKWISVQVQGESTEYRLPLYQ